MVIKTWGLMVSLLSGLMIFHPRLVYSQEIIIDRTTDTSITVDGNNILINGQTLSGDGKNLFHSFQEFGLTNEQIATFLTNPNIQNILTRITGGNPSQINGLLQVVGGHSNLFLMNPAGIIFGQGASLNVPADFTATTATGIGFGNGIFSAVGANDYQNLWRNPDSFIFNQNNIGSIINQGNLTLPQGQNLSLMGGNVINTGVIQTAGSRINIQGVEGTSRIKITPEGSLLSLELDLPTDERGNLLGFSPQDLPSLLTGKNVDGVRVDDGQVRVNESLIPQGQGSAIASGTISTSNSEGMGGDITILGKNVGAIASTITADGQTGGGNIKIGGDMMGQGTIPNASVTYISPDSNISANATTQGDGGNIIIFAQDFARINGNLSATGGTMAGDGGFIETSGLKNFSITSVPNARAYNGQGGEWLIDPYNITITNDADSNVSGINPFNPFVAENNNAILPVTLIQSALSDSDVTISTGITGDQEGNIIWNNDAQLKYNFDVDDTRTLTLDASRNITFNGSINPQDDGVGSLNLVFNANTNKDGKGDINLTNTSSINVNGGDITLNGVNVSSSIDLLTNGGNLTINAIKQINTKILDTSGSEFAGNIKLSAGNSITTLDILADTPSFESNAGNISLSSGNNIKTGNISTQQTDGFGNSGTIALQAFGNVQTGDILSSTFDGSAGAITINASLGAITTDTIFSSGSNSSGNITLNANNAVTTNSIASNASGSTGNININSQNTINVGDVSSVSFGIGKAGNITLNAPDGIVVDAIDASSLNGVAGNIKVTTGSTFRVLETTSFDPNSSIRSVGVNGTGGNISIRWSNPVPEDFSFDVNVGSFILDSINGTRGTINAGLARIPEAGNAPDIITEPVIVIGNTGVLLIFLLMLKYQNLYQNLNPYQNLSLNPYQNLYQNPNPYQNLSLNPYQNLYQNPNPYQNQNLNLNPYLLIPEMSYFPLYYNLVSLIL